MTSAPVTSRIPLVADPRIQPLNEEQVQSIEENLKRFLGFPPAGLVEELQRFLEEPSWHGRVSALDFMTQTIKDSYNRYDRYDWRRDIASTASKAIMVDVGQSWRIK